MKLDDTNHDPSQPMISKSNPLDGDLPFARKREMIDQLRDHVKYATLESYLRWIGWTDDLRIHKEIKDWENGAE